MMLRALLVLGMSAAVHSLTDFSVSPFLQFVAGYQVPHMEKLGQHCTPSEAHKACGGFACVNQTCAKCVHDSECGAESPVYVCNQGVGDCVMKPLDMWNLTHDEFLAGVLAFFITSLAAVAGIGGGGMLVPLYILAAGFPPGLAVSMSQATIIGCSGLKMFFSMMAKHPEGGPLIDFNIIMILMPMTLSGTMLGHMIGRVLPDWLRLGLLVCLLGYMLKRTLAKAAKAAAQDAASQGEKSTLLKKDVEAGGNAGTNSVLQDIIDHRFRQFPIDKLGYCAVVWATLVSFSYMKHKSVECGTLNYWLVTAAIVGSMVALTAAAGSVLRSRDEAAESAGYTLRDDEVRWNTSTIMQYPMLSVTAGIGASLLGIGGGMVLGILLFEMSNKIKPEATAATASVATALVASKACMEFYFYGELPLDYAVYFVLVGCLGTCLGQGPIGAFIRYKNKSSWIVYALAGIIGGSLIALAFAGSLNIYKTYTSGGSMGFRSLCTKSE
eukprot:TRINITY_DN2560_c1_g1_i1.p1 TRINITY_DN2560_c1_g1~~TRINITY_DN2560_c1_g1_i1.p1  ORF type:complete len:536 (+),score=244.75 TRINITY_DN2560_c1_g1_i1:121-1608(+)